MVVAHVGLEEGHMEPSEPPCAVSAESCTQASDGSPSAVSKSASVQEAVGLIADGILNLTYPITLLNVLWRLSSFVVCHVTNWSISSGWLSVFCIEAWHTQE